MNEEAEKLVSIPEHWEWSTLAELAEINPRFSRDDLQEEDLVSFVPMKRVKELSGVIDLSEVRPLGEVRRGYTYFEDGDVLFAKITPCMENGKIAIASNLTNGVGFGSTEFHVVRHDDELFQKWIFYFLIQEGFRRNAKRAMTGSAGQKRVPKNYLEGVPIPIPPRPEQRRLLFKIEEYLSDVDAGVESLHMANHQLERYRLSVLQAAVEGRLTAEWRRKHQPEPVDRLLERILEERREQWEERYRWERYESKGKEPPSGWKSRYSSPEKPSIREELPGIPRDWTWITLDQVLSEDLRNGRSVRSRKGGFPVLRLTAIQDGSLDLSETKEGDWTREEASRFIVEKDDFYVARGNGSLSLVGRGGLVHNVTREVAFPDTMIRVRVDQKFYLPRFLRLVWDSRLVREHLESAAKTSAGIYKINQTDLRTTILPLPPVGEQKRLVDEIERHFSVAHEIEHQTVSGQARSRRLQQSILKMAFSGELLTCGPGDADWRETLEK